MRTQHLAPLMADMHAWLEVSLTRISGRSDMAKAILKRWDALTLVLRDGRACIDNSDAPTSLQSEIKSWVAATPIVTATGANRRVAAFGLPPSVRFRRQRYGSAGGSPNGSQLFDIWARINALLTRCSRWSKRLDTS